MKRNVLFWAFLILAGLSMVPVQYAEAEKQKDDKSKKMPEVWCCDQEGGKVSKVSKAKCSQGNSYGSEKAAREACEVWCCDPERGKAYRTDLAKCKKNAFDSKDDAMKKCKRTEEDKEGHRKPTGDKRRVEEYKMSASDVGRITGAPGSILSADDFRLTVIEPVRGYYQAIGVPLHVRWNALGDACTEDGSYEFRLLNDVLSTNTLLECTLVEGASEADCMLPSPISKESGYSVRIGQGSECWGESSLFEIGGTRDELETCSRDEQCVTLDELPLCLHVATCMGRRVVGRCIDNQCQAVEIPNYAVCAGRICSSGSCYHEYTGRRGYWTPPRACDTNGNCEPVGVGGSCDDSNPCTEDTCLASTGCRNEPVDHSVPCYTGEPGTRGVGACRDGFMQCISGTLQGNCIGQQLPNAEQCHDTVDNDCDTAVDEEGAVGCTWYRLDVDGDGFGETENVRCLCGPVGDYTAANTGFPDCDETRSRVSPMAAESCATPFDDNCDGQINEMGAEGCTPYYRDVDGDGFGQAGDSRCLCAPDELYTVENADDCATAYADINPDAAESCDGRDNDCDGLVDDDDEPLLTLCPTVPNANVECAGILGCRIASCIGSWWDVNRDYANGCEVLADQYDQGSNNNTCGSAVLLPRLNDHDELVTVDANIVGPGDIDWYKIGVDLYHTNPRFLRFRARLQQPAGGSYIMRIHRQSCATFPPVCQGEIDYATVSPAAFEDRRRQRIYHWQVSFFIGVSRNDGRASNDGGYTLRLMSGY